MTITSESLKDFFDKTLSSAKKECHTSMTEQAHDYIVSLLNIYALSENLFDICQHTKKPKNKVLAQKYFSFLEETQKSQKKEILKDLADSSLYMVGFFNEKAQSSVMGINYYIQMGANAYHTLSSLSSSSSQIYKELGENFSPFTTVLRTIKKKTSMNQPENLGLLISEVFEEKEE